MTYGEVVSAVIVGNLIFHGVWWLVRLPGRALRKAEESDRKLNALLSVRPTEQEGP